MTEKQRIDYEIQAKKKANGKERLEWCFAGFCGLAAFFILCAIFG